MVLLAIRHGTNHGKIKGDSYGVSHGKIAKSTIHHDDHDLAKAKSSHMHNILCNVLNPL